MDRAYVLYQENREVCMLSALDKGEKYHPKIGGHSKSTIERIVDKLKKETGRDFSYKLVEGKSKISRAYSKILGGIREEGIRFVKEYPMLALNVFNESAFIKTHIPTAVTEVEEEESERYWKANQKELEYEKWASDHL